MDWEKMGYLKILNGVFEIKMMAWELKLKNYARKRTRRFILAAQHGFGLLALLLCLDEQGLLLSSPRQWPQRDRTLTTVKLHGSNSQTFLDVSSPDKIWTPAITGYCARTMIHNKVMTILKTEDHLILGNSNCPRSTIKPLKVSLEKK
jgi:hypothetical protein